MGKKSSRHLDLKAFWKIEKSHVLDSYSSWMRLGRPFARKCTLATKFHQCLENSIDLCQKEMAEDAESTGLKRAREETDSDSKSEKALLDRSDASTFKDVKTRHDVAILVANKYSIEERADTDLLQADIEEVF
jgi:hypothetical protein